jgi:hypothetical protein
MEKMYRTAIWFDHLGWLKARVLAVDAGDARSLRCVLSSPMAAAVHLSSPVISASGPAILFLPSSLAVESELISAPAEEALGGACF